MEEESATRYWCHMCSLSVNPVMETEISCPFCQSGFVEEMEEEPNSRPNHSLWSPIFTGIMNNQSVDDNHNQAETENETGHGRETHSEILRRRIRHSFADHQGIRGGLTLEYETESNLHREPVILINSFNQTVMDDVHAGSLGDYYLGPRFELLRQQLTNNGLSRYGTPPASKEAIEALATVKIDETLECSVCLDDFEIGTEAKQMPCKHKFHGDCLFPWLQRHSSCPLCRYQLPKAVRDNNASATNSHGSENNNGANDDRNRHRFSIQRQFSIYDLFSLPRDNNQSTDGS